MICFQTRMFSTFYRVDSTVDRGAYMAKERFKNGVMSHYPHYQYKRTAAQLLRALKTRRESIMPSLARILVK